MTGGVKLGFTVFAAVFATILCTALFSDVSLSASLTRALSAATFFTVLLWGIFKIISCCILANIKALEESAAAAHDEIGGTLNITVADDLSHEELLNDNRQHAADNANNANNTNNTKSANNAAAVSHSDHHHEPSVEEFSPLAAQQIDPQIEKIINNDPKRIAEIVKKMGFDD